MNLTNHETVKQNINSTNHAIKQNNNSLQYTSDGLKNNYNIIFESVKSK